MTDLDAKVLAAIERRASALIRLGHDPDAVIDALAFVGLSIAAAVGRVERAQARVAELAEEVRAHEARREALARAEPGGRA